MMTPFTQSGSRITINFVKSKRQHTRSVRSYGDLWYHVFCDFEKHVDVSECN